MKKITAILIILIIVCGIAYASAPKVEDYFGWYIMMSMVMNTGGREDVRIIQLGDSRAYIYHTTKGKTVYYSLISPALYKDMDMDLKKFTGL